MEASGTEATGQLDRYKLLEQLGTGGMSVVYRAWDTALDREVAVKLLHPHLAGDPDSRRRFSREARAVAKLHHPNILEIYDFSGEGAPTAYIVTEFIRGVTLRQFADIHGFGPPALGALAAHTLTAAVEHAHQFGIVHRDIKPENAMVREDGVLKLMDFGIARMIGQGDRMTVTGALVGSPAHMAPEIIEGKNGDARSDIFSLGTLLYWLTTGVLPFAAPNTSAVLKRVLDGDCADPRALRPDLSDQLAACIRDAMARDPEKRIQTASELRSRLEEVLREDGLDHPAEELAHFYQDPIGYRQRFEEALPGRLVELARASARRGEVARTLSLVNRILVLDPGNSAAGRLLRTLRRRTRLLQGARAALLVLIAAGVGLGLSRAFIHRTKGTPPAVAALAPTPEPSPPAPPPTLAAPPPIVASADTPAKPPTAPVRAPRPHLAPRPQTSPAPPKLAVAPAPEPGASATVTMHIKPWADVYVDGIQRASGAPSVEMSLSPGTHLLQLKHPDCQPFQETLVVQAGGNMELRRELLPRPARLRIRAFPADAKVMIDSVFKGSADQTGLNPISVPMEDQQKKREVNLRVYADGFVEWQKQITLSANREESLSVTLIHIHK